jgi:2-isopropylmalate synthase
VTIEFLDAETHEIYGTVGVSENIIDASWQALVDGFEYKLINDEERVRKTAHVKATKAAKPATTAVRPRRSK